MSKRKSKSLLEQASDAVEEILPVVEESLESAYESAKEAFSDGREAAANAFSDGREAASHAFDEVAAETKRRVGKDKKKGKKKKLRTALLLSVFLGAGAVVFKMLRSKSEQPPWAASAAPANTPAPAAPAPVKQEAPAHDEAGATPGEALADASEEPHPDTTPDAPAEVVELDKPE